MQSRVFKDRLREHRVLIANTRGAHDLTQAAVAQHICVSTNGYFEIYVKKSIQELFRKRCDPKAFRIVTKATSGFFNFKSDKIVVLFQEIYPERAFQVKQYLKSNEQFSDAIGSIVGNKNTIAHEGRSAVSLQRVDGWLVTILQDIDDFETVCFK